MKEKFDIQREIASVYSDRRNRARALRAERYEEVCLKIPAYGEADNEIKRLGVKLGRLAIEGKKGTEEYGEVEKMIARKSEECAKILLGGGFSKDYLEDVYECAICKDSGAIEGEDGAQKECACYMKLYTGKLHGASNLSQDEGFEGFSLDYYSKEKGAKGGMSPYENAELALLKAKAFVSGFGTEKAKNMLFIGGTGVGKTYLSGCVACELMRRGVSVLCISADEMFEVLTYYGNDEDRRQKREMLEKVLYSVELLVLDDLGAEKQTATRYSLLVELLNRRGANDVKRRTVVTSNLSLKALNEEYYDERVFSRLMAFDVCELTGKDIRIIKKLEG